MNAKKNNDLTYVIVCGHNGEERGRKEGLPVIKRYRIIKNFLEDELLKVIYINDDDLGLDQSMSPSNWDIWTKAVMDQTNITENDNVTWYVAEKFYVERLTTNCAFKCKIEFLDRTINPITGTDCRNNPLKHWNDIALPFRAYFSHNILIAGTASEGKTTLTRDIGKYYGLPYSYEKGRDICGIKTDPEFTVRDFIYNIYEQHKYNEELIKSPQNPGIFISDTDNMVTLMYAYYYKQRDDFALSDEDYEVLYQMTKSYRDTTKWDKIFLIKPRMKNIVDDGERYMPDGDYQIRCEFFEFLKKLYDEFGYEYEILDGTYYENYLSVRRYIDEL
jgi:NadR type nicotinamide-nucleotide adenylyltransferase